MTDLPTRKQIVDVLNQRLVNKHFTGDAIEAVADVLVKNGYATERVPGAYWVQFFEVETEWTLCYFDGACWVDLRHGGKTWGEPLVHPDGPIQQPEVSPRAYRRKVRP